MDRELEIAKKAAVEAGKVLMKHYGKVSADRKKDGSLITVADTESENLVKGILSEAFPDYSFLGEETGIVKKASEYIWLVDPLDGTTNYSMKNPFFNVSIGLVKGNEPVIGVVFSPVQNELFYAAKGRGAFMNGKRINVSANGDLKKSSIGFCHARGEKDVIEKITKIFHTFKGTINTFRQLGAAALELAYVGAGRLDAFVHIDINPWDVVAGVVIVREAGGKVTDFSNEDYVMDSKELAATNGKLHGEILKSIKKSIG